MSENASFRRYQDFTPITLPDRTWPDKRIDRAPRWLSTDLRDGNQALPTPMTPVLKLAVFELLCRMGYKEIEVGFPVASQDEHDFVRMLIEQDRIPDDVRISVLVQARDELIERTVASLRGVRQATVHVYNATAPLFRRVVFGMDRTQCRDLAVQATGQMMRHTERLLSGSDIGYQYSPELFNETEPDFVLEVLESVMDVWQPEAGREIILNLPTTVERSLPNVFADQIEWLDRRLSRREHVCLSVHPHNDRGTGVASTEMALLAGAQRVEGCLFGHGERAGNVCLVTLGLNLLTHGVDPRIDFSDLDRGRRLVEACTGMPVHARHPYAGDLVYTAFSGSHQDAINKGFAEQERAAAAAAVTPGELAWEMPYLPLDPNDVGRTYDAIVRINSQSGKGGTAYVMSAWHGLHLPRELHAEFAAVVQARTQETGAEVVPAEIGRLFAAEYVAVADESVVLPPAAGLAADLWIEGARPAAADLGAELAAQGVVARAVHHLGADTASIGAVTVYARCEVTAGCPAPGRRDVTAGAVATTWGVGHGTDAQTAAARAVRAARLRSGITPDREPRPVPQAA